MTSKLLFSGVSSRECSRSEQVSSWRKSFSCVELIVMLIVLHVIKNVIRPIYRGD